MFHCFSWLRCLWSDPPCQDDVPKKGTSNVLSLPDDMTVDILSRLPIETVVACREVCERWRSLTSTPNFSQLHSTRVGFSPIILLQYELPHELHESMNQGDERPVMYVEGLGLKLVEAKEVFMGGYKCGGNSPELLASCNGFLLLKLYNVSMYVICNPITLEGGLTLTWLPHQRVSVIGFFFNESIKEYMLLLSQHGKCFREIHYSLYSLSTRVLRPLGKMRYTPDISGIRLAVHMNEALFFMVEHQYRDGRSHPHCSRSIMMVKVNKHDGYLTLLPHPGNRCGFISAQEKHANMRLSSETDERMLFTRVDMKAVHVWVSKDIVKWMWVKLFVMDYDRFESRSFLCFGEPSVYDHEPRFLGIQNGELVLHWPHRGIYLYNMKLKSVRKIKGSRLPKDSSACVYALSSIKSLASLSDLTASDWDSSFHECELS